MTEAMARALQEQSEPLRFNDSEARRHDRWQGAKEAYASPGITHPTVLDPWQKQTGRRKGNTGGPVWSKRTMARARSLYSQGSVSRPGKSGTINARARAQHKARRRADKLQRMRISLHGFVY